MTGPDLASMYGFSYFAVSRNLNELTHEDSVFIPEPSGNCIKVLGHIICARGMMLLFTGRSSVECGRSFGLATRFGCDDGWRANDGFGRLKTALEESHKKLIPALLGLSDEAFAAEVPEKLKRPPLTASVGDALARLCYHDGYHNGQIGILRRLAGKEGAIR